MAARIIEQCYEKSIEVLKRNTTKLGIRASETKYNSIWARDGAICTLGACISGNRQLLKAAKATILTLKRHQASMGQIPTVKFIRLPYEKGYHAGSLTRWHGTDSTPWWIIGMHYYVATTGDSKVLLDCWPSLENAVRWILYQDTDNYGLITSLEGGDWMDGSVQRSGKVFYVNAVALKALELANALAKSLGKPQFYDTEKMRTAIDRVFWPAVGTCDLPFSWFCNFFESAINEWRRHYLDYVTFERFEDRCDVLANSLAILWSIADEKKTKHIIKFFLDKEVADPYPVRVLEPAIFEPTHTWKADIDSYRPDRWKSNPYHYHNSGVWPYVGAFYAMALQQAGYKAKAKEALEKLAEANRLGKKGKWRFNEHLHGWTGEPLGAELQSWNAGAFIAAYEHIFEKKNVFDLKAKL